MVGRGEGGGSWGKIHSRGVGGGKMLRGVDSVRGIGMRRFVDGGGGGMGGGVTQRGGGYLGGAEWVTGGGGDFGGGGDAGGGVGDALLQRHATAYAGHQLDAQVAYAEHQLALKASYTSSLRPNALVAYGRMH